MDKYTPPKESHGTQVYSIYVDASYCDNSFKYATTFAVFDPGGKLIAAGYMSILPPGSVMAAELQAIRDGINFWKNNLNGHLKIMSDSIESIHAIRINSIYKGVEKELIKELRTRILDPSVKDVWYCGRKNNTTAHNLAKIASRSPHPCDWVRENIPRHIISLASTT